ncbi:hypothetical protein AQUCO_02200182v1 [Aquilegia coerulea]|uniref:F-box associated domain-containing protein n=1 Tax=Aquilegia coerulea TaxID=218851 RepID=A0A2G5DDG0_AQUCA|nr:hypothetical protein AQUCO_02200182v1 [Aquilegia coerulea]
MKSYIGVLDIGDETFRTFEKPFRDIVVRTRTLCSLRQCLCLIDQAFDDHIVVWTMKQYGVVRSWTKEHVIRKERFGSLQTMSFYTLDTMKNGIVLIDHGCEYQGYYDFEQQEFKRIFIDGIHSSPQKLQIVLHVGSLISPRSITCIKDIHQVSFAKPRRPIRFRLNKNVKRPT